MTLNKKNVLVISDTHEPFCREGYLEHCIKVSREFSCGTIIHAGDEVDNCAISDFEHDPDGLSPGNEYKEALKMMKKWYKIFPIVGVCIGNHSARIFRKARASGLSANFIKPYQEIWEAPKTWKWADSWDYLGVHYTHGTGLSGKTAALKLAMQYRQNCVIGHIHSEAGINYSASKKDLIWGMNVGGALDDTSYAAAYSKDMLNKSIVGCGVVINGELPLFIPMKL